MEKIKKKIEYLETEKYFLDEIKNIHKFEWLSFGGKIKNSGYNL